MLTLTIVAALAGAVLGLRFSIAVLVPAIFIGAAIAATSGVALAYSAQTIVLTVFLVAASLQVSYLTGCVIRVILALARASHGGRGVLRGRAL